MLPAARILITELDNEAKTTRRVLERVPQDRFEWQPHPKSMSAGQLAQHIASIPGSMARLAAQDGFDMSTRRWEHPPAESASSVLATFDEGVASVREFIAGLDESRATATWRMTYGDREIFAIPRLAMLRTMAFNHWYHHRGEMVVYLRLLGIPVPAVYGRSADENPFAQLPA